MKSSRPATLVAITIFLFAFVLVDRPARAGLDVWTPIGPFGGTVRVLRFAPGQPGRVYAGTQENGFFRSTDGGASWTPMNRGLPPSHRDVWNFVVTATSPPVIYASFGRDLFRSVDGAPWKLLETSPGLYPAVLAADPADPESLLGSCYGRPPVSRICRSSDGGRTWKTLYALPSNHAVTSIVIDPRSSSRVLYAAVGGEHAYVLRSRDRGATWEQVRNLPSLELVTDLSLAVAPDTGYVYLSIILARNGGTAVYRSTNQGRTWALNGRGGYPVAAGPGGFVVTGRGARSLDHGATWRLGEGLEAKVLSLAVNPFAPRRALAGTRQRGIYRTVSGVSPWRPSNQGLTATQALSIVADPAHPGTLYASVAGGGLFKTTDGGTAWDGIEAGSRGAEGLITLKELAVDGASTVYALHELGIPDDSVLRGEDGGAVWTDLRDRDSLPPMDRIAALAADPATPGVLYIGGSGTPFSGYRTEDSGETWTGMTTHGIREIAVAHGEPDDVYVIGDQIYRSTDGGESWEVASVGLRGDGAVTVAVAPSDPNVLYTFYYRLGVLRSTDQGRTWQSATGDLDQRGNAGSLVVHPSDPATVYFVLTGNIYRTVDGGRTWKRLVIGGEDLWSGALILDPEDPRTLYAGTSTRGFYTITLTR